MVIDDIKYEIFCTQEYVDSLKENIQRLKKAEKYFDKMQQSKNEHKENYYYEYTKLYLEPGENLDNFIEIRKQYEDAYVNRKAKINNLYDEIKRIKKLKI